VRDTRPEYVGFSVKSATFGHAVSLHEHLYRQFPAITYLYGGPHATLAGADCLGTVPPAFVFRGEAETALPEFLARHAAGEADFSAIRGLVYRDADGQVHDGGVRLESHLDELPLPDFTVFDSFESFSIYPLLTSRGCPYKCTYCSVPTISGKFWRARGVDSVLRELRHAHDTLGLRTFVVVDDNFTVHHGRAMAICEALAADSRRFHWSCGNGIRADRITAELAASMVKAGCAEVAFGVESLDPEVFGALRKGESIDQVRSAVRIARDAGLAVTGFFMIGLPGSTYRRDLRTLARARRLGLNNYYFGLTVPYPGTELWQWSQAQARFLVPWENSYHISEVFRSGAERARVLPVFDTPDYPAAQRARLFELAQSVKTRTAERQVRDLNRELRIGPGVPVVVLRTSRRADALDVFRGIGRNRPHYLLWTGPADALDALPPATLESYRRVHVSDRRTFEAGLVPVEWRAALRHALVIFDAPSGSLEPFRNVIEFARGLEPLHLVALAGDRLDVLPAADGRAATAA
jgi:anaerobic magnesium-protoporphyrin IX monomethyl ester cyclase